ncbi:MAG TPA: hypothetical protein VMY77_14530 [Chitinophagaceae bacterium]|nr:hypothetical protein [Chitinophagaceae bacterium]
MEKLPSTLGRHQIGASVVINFGKQGLITSCEVSGVKATDNGKIFYDIKVYPFKGEEEEKLFCLLQNVDSYFVEDPVDRLIGMSNMDYQIEK